DCALVGDCEVQRIRREVRRHRGLVPKLEADIGKHVTADVIEQLFEGCEPCLAGCRCGHWRLSSTSLNPKSETPDGVATPSLALDALLPDEFGVAGDLVLEILAELFGGAGGGGHAALPQPRTHVGVVERRVQR